MDVAHPEIHLVPYLIHRWAASAFLKLRYFSNHVNNFHYFISIYLDTISSVMFADHHVFVSQLATPVCFCQWQPDAIYKFFHSTISINFFNYQYTEIHTISDRNQAAWVLKDAQAVEKALGCCVRDIQASP
jgi:hypothetical protein